MWFGTILAAVGLFLGLFIGLKVPIVLPESYAPYLGLAVLAALDSVFGGIRAGMEDHFDNTVFLSGFFANALFAAGLAYIGERLGVPLSTAAVVAFGVRLFQNLAIIRRHLLKK
ncbi:small basic protein [Desulfohalotomaculum tongense]|uniref:small basic family protein n=1 Tax=Desulforadius tongensis TaxID=1216062 RepID=UPI00195EC28F|nr:small basic family protein [Desulforadius tongensis]MBM7855220.1 small basic protein [Desulforadius tongensis]